MFYRVMKAIVKALYFILFNIRFEGEPCYTPGEPLMICANHYTMLDPVTIAVMYPGQIRFIGKAELSRNRFLRWFLTRLGIIFIDRKANDLRALRESMNALKDGAVVGIFPEGTRVKAIDPANIKQGVSLMALRAKTDIQCVRIRGEYGFRKRLVVEFKPPIHCADYEALPAQEARLQLTADIFNRIYDTDFPVEAFVRAD